MKDRILLTILGGVVGIGILIWAITSNSSGSKYERLRTLELAATIKPVESGADRPPVKSSAGQTGKSLRLYLDVSESMAGYLQAGEDEGKAGFRTVVHLVPDHLLRLYGPISSVDWVAVDSELRPILNEPRFQKNEFRGSETYLDLAVEEGFSLLSQGKIEAFALVTDLVATREVSGALGLYNAIREWLLGAEVRQGELDFGLFGVRVPFRGVANGKCQASGGLGCWYSERGRRWHSLSTAAERPFYVLIFGRTGLKGGTSNSAKSLVSRTGTALLEDVKSLGLEARWELLTRLARAFPATLRCEVGDQAGKEQFALLREPQGRFRCQQNQQVVMGCRLASSQAGTAEALPVELAPTSVQTSWPENLVTAKINGSRIEMQVDCGELGGGSPEEGLYITALAAEPSEPPAGWSEWSVESDESEEQLGRTLQLRHFITGARPETFEVEIPEPLLGVRP